MSIEGQRNRTDAQPAAAREEPLSSKGHPVEDARLLASRSGRARRHATSPSDRRTHRATRSRGETSSRSSALRDRQRPDALIREDLYGRFERALAADSRDVAVEVNNGLVMLEGTVLDRHTKYRIEDLAEVCPGVREVDNRIRVQQPEEQGA